MQKNYNNNAGIFLFNIIPRYRAGISNVFDYARETFSAAVLPTVAQRLKQNTLFIDLEDLCGECLSELDLLYIFANDGAELVMGEFVSDFAKINWVNPGTFTPSEPAGALTFTPNIGYEGDAAATYFDTGFIPSTHGVNYQTNDACVFCYIANEISSSAKADYGVNSGISDPSVRLNSRNASNQHDVRINFAPSFARGTGVTSTGFYQLQKNSVNARLFKNGAQVGSDISVIATGVPNRFIPLFANNNNGTIGSFSNRQMGMFGLGASLAGGESALYTAWNNYFTSL